MQLPLVVKEKQNRPTITEAEISAMLTTLKGRDAVLVALVAGTGLRIGEALAIRTDDFDPLCRLLQVGRSVWRFQLILGLARMRYTPAYPISRPQPSHP